MAGGSGAEATSGQQGAPAQTLSARLKVATAEADAQRRRADDLQEALDRAVRAAGGGGSQVGHSSATKLLRFDSIHGARLTSCAYERVLGLSDV